ncbi:MAG: 5-oxoprolinase subunit PxpB [Rhodocyclales bacterium]|nr:5-oxoprolinase subunit PxpB [Rhodocyclales bacterium]
MALSILDAGDTAFTIEFGNAIDPALQAEVDVLDHAIEHACARGELHGVIETVPTFRSLTVIYNPVETDRETLLARVMPLAQAATHARTNPARHWLLPACYEGDAAPDLADTAKALGASPERVVELHATTEYVVYMLGFLPGFPFMGDLPEALRLPRRTEPRVRVPPGSIAIAAGLTAIYPWESPGGWHLLGRCPVPLFDPSRAQPALLRAGDRVRFTAISSAECARLDRALAAGELDPDTWCQAEAQTA